MSDHTIKITLADSLWSYCAQLVSIGSGIILLPLILNKLTAEDVAVYYIILSLSSLITLFDFGFSSQFGRNISYVFSGARILKKEGVEYSICRQVDFHLLLQLIKTAQYIYKRLALFAFFILLFGGSWYLYCVTDGFSTTSNLLSIWIIYIISNYFKVRFLYYNAFLMGKGSVRELQQITVLCRVFNILLCVLFLFFNWGLISLVLSDFFALFVQVFLVKKRFYTLEIKNKLFCYIVDEKDIKSMYTILWYNAKKIGLTFFAGFLVSQLGLFFVGLYLSLEMVASYGLMYQLVAVITTLSSTLLSIHIPFFSSCIVREEYRELLERFSVLLLIYYFLFILGVVILVLVVPPFLIYINSKVVLPSVSILIVYSLIRLLETNHSNFASILVLKNKVPYMKAALYSGLFTLLGLIIVLKYTEWNLWGIILVPGIIQGVYQNWKWPKEVCKEYDIGYFELCVMYLKKNMSSKTVFMK